MAIHWFKKHLQFLHNESVCLSTDSNYKELLQKRDDLLISHGYVLVRLEKLHKFPIVIVYAPATPYAIPYIYPLNRELTEEEICDMAANFNGRPPIDSIKYYSNHRHQNGGGTLCFLECESFDDGGEFYGITSIIKRVKDWFQGHITGVYPPENEIVSYTSHFNKISPKFQLIYPEQFVLSTYIQGEFIARLYFDIPDCM